jgi:hypothetical protein
MFRSEVDYENIVSQLKGNAVSFLSTHKQEPYVLKGNFKLKYTLISSAG